MSESSEGPRVELDWHEGQTRLSIDGVNLPPLGYCTSVLDRRQLELFVARGVRIISFPTTCDHHLYSLASTVWSGPGSYDWSQLDHRMSAVLDAAPDAYLLPRVYTSSPPWWDRLHPEELVHWGNGTTRLPLHHGANKDQVPSLASKQWWRDRRENLRAYLRHVEGGPFASRVIGYHVTSGNSEEWFHWGVMEGESFDYSPAMQERFRHWLSSRYGSEAALSEAWGRALHFAEVDVPHGQRRRIEGPYRRREFPGERDLVDFARFLAELTADSILDLASLVKEEGGGRKLFGTFYGYLAELSYHPNGLAFGGHLALQRLLESSGKVDFLASPGSYARRNVGDGFSFSMLPTGSLEKARLASFHENDVRTHCLADDAGYGRTLDAMYTASIQRRELASALTRGQGLWWFDMTAGWFDDPAVLEAIDQLVGVTRHLQQHPRLSVAEAAFVLDEECLIEAIGHPNQMIEAVVRPLHELSRLGAPVEVIRLRDLDDSHPYKLLVFPVLWDLDGEELEKLHARLARWRAVAVWLGPRQAHEGVDSREDTRSLCGFEILAGERQRQIARTLSGESFGSPRIHFRNSRIAAGEGDALAHFSKSGTIAAASRSMPGGWQSLLSLVSALPASLFRQHFKAAGGWIYSADGDGVDACNRLVSVHARRAGVRTLCVPGTEVLYDLVNEVELRAKDTEFRFYLARGDTALFYRGPRSEW